MPFRRAWAQAFISRVQARRMTIGSYALGGASAAAVVWTASRIGYRRTELGPPPEPPPLLAPGQLRAITLNAWRMSDPARVPKLVLALEHLGRSLAQSECALPEIFAIQEIESQEAFYALKHAIAATHDLITAECSFRRDGSMKSGVALGVARDAFCIERSQCIELGRIWPDARRCAIRADVRARNGSPFTIVGTHMAWHPDNTAMSERLLSALPIDRPMIVLGDFNTWPARRSYQRLVSGALRDACVGAPVTTPIKLRVDLVLVSYEWRVERALSRRSAFDAFGVDSFFRWGVVHHALSGRGHPDRCPVSDHLPEGAVLALIE
jgi:endonuclease/exonuclease/phosphatase family metal-dependent hydrolase